MPKYSVENTPNFKKAFKEYTNSRYIDLYQMDANFPMQNHHLQNKVNLQRIRNSQTVVQKPLKTEKPRYQNNIECNDLKKSFSNQMRYQKKFHQNFLKKISNVKLPPIESVNGRKIQDPANPEKVDIATGQSLSRTGSSRIDVMIKTNDSTLPDEMNNTILEKFEAPTSSAEQSLVNYDSYNYNLDIEIQKPFEVFSDSMSLSDNLAPKHKILKKP